MVIQSNSTSQAGQMPWPTPKTVESQAPQAADAAHPVQPADQTSAKTSASHAPAASARLSSAKGQSAPEMRFVADPFDQAYAQLTPSQKQAYDSLIQSSVKVPGFLAPKPSLPGPFTAPQAKPTLPASPFENVDVKQLDPAQQAQLRKLLCDGTLQRKSSDGQTILEHLAGLMKNQKADKQATISGPGLVRDLLKMLQPEDLNALKASAANMQYHLNDKGQRKQNGIPMPGGLGEITQCSVHYTCGAASMQVWMRLNQPEELVRIADDLFSKGKSTLHGGTLKPAKGSLDFHAGDKIYDNELYLSTAGREDRTDLDILLQSSLMDKVAIGNLSNYDVNADSGGIMNVVGGNSGAQPLYMAREMEKLTGKPFAYAHNLNLYKTGGVGRFFANLSDRTPQAELVAQLKSQLNAGKQVMIAYQTRADDSLALHYVTVFGYDAKTDRYFIADTDEEKATRAKMYTKSTQEMMDVLRAVVYQK